MWIGVSYLTDFLVLKNYTALNKYGIANKNKNKNISLNFLLIPLVSCLNMVLSLIIKIIIK